MILYLKFGWESRQATLEFHRLCQTEMILVNSLSQSTFTSYVSSLSSLSTYLSASYESSRCSKFNQVSKTQKATWKVYVEPDMRAATYNLPLLWKWTHLENTSNKNEPCKIWSKEGVIKVNIRCEVKLLRHHKGEIYNMDKKNPYNMRRNREVTDQKISCLDEVQKRTLRSHNNIGWLGKIWIDDT